MAHSEDVTNEIPCVDAGSDGTAPRVGAISPLSDAVVYVGSAPNCQICVSGSGIVPRHAVLWRRGNRVFIKNWGTDTHTSVNGVPLRPGSWKEITLQDEITLGVTNLHIPAEIFQPRNTMGLCSTPLLYRTGIADRPRFTVLTDGAFFKARPGTLTAVMGPAGCGKSVLLTLLAGENRPSQGRVFVYKASDKWPPDASDLYDVHRDRDSMRDLIGYVPQEDVMIPELTVRESLDTRLRLRFPDMEPSLRTRVIEETAFRLGFEGEARAQRFLNSIVGAPGSGYRGLSGGERRRANIGLELVAKPGILFLDEPTSGLSSIEAERIVALLRDLADTSGLTIVATIHQPSKRSFQQFDDVMVLGLGGRIAYYGPTSYAVEYFEALTEKPCGDLNPAAYILDFLDTAESMERVIRVYHDRTLTQATDQLPSPLPLDTTASLPATTGNGSVTGVVSTFFQQVRTLSKRGFVIAYRDRTNLLLMGAQVPIIALLIICAYHGLEYDYRKLDLFARTIHHFNKLADARLAEGETVRVEKVLQEAAALSETDSSRISEPTARHRAAVLFLMVAASVWFGMIAACREIAAEFHILKRETRSCLRLLPYLLSKLVVLSVLLGVQTSVLAFIVTPVLLGVPLSALGLICLTLWVAALGSACLGLLVSGASSTTRVALTAVPVLLVPQLILGGLLRGPVSIEQGAYAARVLSALMTQRWAFEACLAADRYADEGVLVQQPGDLQNLGWERGASLKILRVVDKPLGDLFFHRTKSHPILRGITHIVLLAVACMATTWFILKWRLGPG